MSKTIRHDAQTPEPADSAWPPTLAPYLAVHDARRAVDWYIEVFGAHRRGDFTVMPDGSVGHVEVGIGDSVLMLAEGSSEVPVQPPSGGTFSHTIHVLVDDVDGVVERARKLGGEVEREPVDQPYGRVAVIVDPFNHRWMVNTPPGRATRLRHGDVGYITMLVPDDERARTFYGEVLGWRFTPGSIAHDWEVERVQPMLGLAGGAAAREIQLCYRVDDIEAAADRVRQCGGKASVPTHKQYGLMVECIDDQGTPFQLWQPTD